MTAVSRVVGLFKKAANDIELSAPIPALEFKISFDEGFHDDEEAPTATPDIEYIGRAYGIVYGDSKGRGSRRRITVRSLVPQKSDLLIRAFCHERQAARSFKASRIEQILDLQTGEVVHDATEFFARYLSDDPTFDALRNSGPRLQVLTFMALCDRNFHPTKLECIVSYVDSRATAPVDFDAVARHVEGLHPDTETFDRGLEILSEQGEDELKSIVRWLRRIVDADGVISDDEFQWLVGAEDILKLETN